MNEREAYIALNMMEDVGPVTVRKLVSALGSADAIFRAEEREIAGALGRKSEVARKLVAQRGGVRIDKELKRAEKIGARLITPLDVEYPEPLSHIHDPPLALYIFGNMLPADKRAIAVVGCRGATYYGRDAAERLSRQLAMAGFTVVSGLARGIDTAAHRGVLQGKGRGIAVLGGGLDCLYPPENSDLASELAQNGAVISEFPIGRQPDKSTFPMRNRIISGLSMGVLVVEAGLKSGALITVGQALDQGRSVFAVPGRIDSPASFGTHRLIRDGARLVESVDDILAELEYLVPACSMGKGEQSPEAARHDLSPEEESVLRALDDGETDVDALIRRTGLQASAMCSLLLGLEMKRLVRMLPGRVVEVVRHG